MAVSEGDNSSSLKGELVSYLRQTGLAKMRSREDEDEDEDG